MENQSTNPEKEVNIHHGLAGAIGTPPGVWGIHKLIEIEKQSQANHACGQSQALTRSSTSVTTRPVIPGNPQADKSEPLQGVRKLLTQVRPTGGLEDKQQEPIQTKAELKPDKVSQDLPEASIEETARSNLEYLRSLLAKCGGIENLLEPTGDAASKRTYAMEDPRALRCPRISHPGYLSGGSFDCSEHPCRARF